MPNHFAVETTQQDQFTVLTLDGYLDAHTAPVFEKAVQEAFDSERHQIIVDCSKLTYISSAGLGVFMSFIEEIRDQGGDIKICGIVPKVRQVFDILGFNEIFDIVETAPEAMQKFSETPQAER